MSESGLVGQPTARPNAGYRLVRLLCRLASRLFVVRVSGLELLPRDAGGRVEGGWICAGLPHRTWAEPVILIGLLPARPRLAMIADAPTAIGSWWRRLLVGRVGGVVLIPRRAGGGIAGFERHLAAVRRVLEAGAVLSIFPEVGRPAPPPALRRLSPALAYFALRTGAPIVPVVFGGTHELFLRRPIEVRVLAPIAPPVPAPPPGTPSEREAADSLMRELRAVVEPVAGDLHAAAGVPAAARRRWRWLQGNFPRPE